MAGSSARKPLSLLLTGLCVAVALVRANHGTFYSFKSPKEKILNYQTLLPLVEWTTSDPSSQLMVTLNSTTANYTLKLQLNVGLLSPSFSARYHDDAGKIGIQKGHKNCFYHGEVVEEKEWTVVLSTCLGLRGSFGPRGNPTHRYHIEPLHYYKGSSDLMQPHVLYLGSEYTTAGGTCGTKRHGGDVKVPQHILSQGSQRLRRQSSLATVEWTLINDNEQYLTFSSNLTLVVLRAIEIANGVDELFKVERVRVVVVDVITWTMGDPIDVTTDPGQFLENLGNYSPNLPQHYDSVMLFTGIEFNGTTIGIAFTATMCVYLQSSVGIVQDGGEQIDKLISTTAHELGHIFAMDHDTSSCTCTDPLTTCIMKDKLGSPPPTTWSSCSVETLRHSLGSDLGLCLDNVPTTTVTYATCGNGIQEAGEACDCGSVEECTDPCCNSTSCKLVTGAECRTGACCQSDCQLKDHGTICRRMSTECDVEEYCTGDNADCPRDQFVQDLTPCMNNEFFCFSGQCQSRESQCQHHYNTGDAIDACYTRVNVRGDVFGHCGFSNGDYIPCLEMDAFCGQLQCRSDGKLQTSPGFDVTFTLFPESYTCKSVTTKPDGDEISPGLVRDGTRCGDQMVCFNMKCVNTSVLEIPPCPFDSSGKVCSGNGQCNNKHRCSCFVGFQGPRCDEIVDSQEGGGKGGGGGGGGGGAQTGNGGVIAGIVISLILVLAIIGGISALILYLVWRTKSTSNTYYSRRVTYRASAASTRITPTNGRAPPPVSKPPQPPRSVAPTRPPNPSAPPRPPPLTQSTPPRQTPPARPTPPRPHPPTNSKPSPAPKRPPPLDLLDPAHLILQVV